MEIITQEEMLDKGKKGKLSLKTLPIKFANGYFVKGTSESGREFYATVKELNRNELEYLLNSQIN